MRFGQNVLRMTWKERFVQFSWKAPSSLFYERVLGQHDDFDNFDAHKCDLAKTCYAWPGKSVLYNFHEKRTILKFWSEFQASVTNLRTLMLKNAISPKRATHELKKAFCTIFMKSALFSRFEENFRPVWRFWQLWRSQMWFGQNVQAWPEKSVLYNSHGKRTILKFWSEFQASVTNLRTLMLKNAISPKRATHELKKAFCTIFMKSALFSRFEENFRPVWRFWQLWRSQMWFGQNVLGMTWKERFVQFSWKAHCFLFLKRIWGQCDDFDNFDAQKCDLAKTFSAWPKKSVLYNFHKKRTVFTTSRELEASMTILTTLTLKNAIWPKRATHDLKTAFCTIFMKGALFCLFGENLRPVWRFWQRWHWKMRFGQNVLRMTWKERFVQFSWKLHCFPVLKRILGQCDDFKNFDAQKWDLAKTCSAWLEKSLCTIFMESALF